MADVLTREQVGQAQQDWYEGDRLGHWAHLMIASHEELRARLERAEQERDEARHTANGAENNRRWAQGLLDIAVTECNEARDALREARGCVHFCAIRHGPNVSQATIDLLHRIDAVLGAAGEEQEPAGG